MSLLEVDKVSISFDGIKVLDDLSLSLEAGELRFLIGPNGAGKTTLIDVVSAKTRPHAGRISFDGADVLRLESHDLARRGMGRKFQTPAIFPSLTVRENLEVAGGSDQRHGGWRLIRPLHSEVQDRIADALHLTRLSGELNTRAGLLSHGQQQWLEIGMLLVQSPRLMLLDEPVAGLTRAERDRTSELLQSVQQRCAILIVEHDMAFVRQFDARVTVLHQGRVLVEGPLPVVQRDERVIEVYLGRLDTAEAEVAA
ncbi:MAG TPA: urea ABC transporter ATP-binding protein UrtD [Chloroflexota bacterium]